MIKKKQQPYQHLRSFCYQKWRISNHLAQSCSSEKHIDEIRVNLSNWEIHLVAPNVLTIVNSYYFLRKDRNRHDGGVAIYMLSRRKFRIFEIEGICAEVQET